MKRRTRPAAPRPPRPAPRNSGLEHFFPGIDALSDIEGFKMLFQVVCLAPPSESDLAHRFLALFVESRGLEVHEQGNGFKGFTVYQLLRKDGVGGVLASFSSEFR